VPFLTQNATVVSARRGRAIPGASYLGLVVLVLACVTAVALTAEVKQPGLLPYYAAGGISLSVFTACIVQACRVGMGSGTASTHPGTEAEETNSGHLDDERPAGVRGHPGPG
jgi:hypothetical protein